MASRRYRMNQIVFIKDRGPALITTKHWRSCDMVMYLWGGSRQCPYHQLREATDKGVGDFFQLTSESEAFFAEEAA